MRKAVCAVAALLLLLAVSACGDAGVRDVLPVSEPPAGDASVPDGTDEPPRFEPNRALFYADAPDGHSIMADGGRLYCVNARGEVTYSLPCGERNATRLCGGVFLSYDGITARLRRADGSEVAVEGGTDKLDLLFLSGDTCFDYEAFQSGVTEAQRRNIMANELLEDGYILALRASDGGTSPVFELGVLRIDGRWAVPPTADHPLLWALAGDAPDALLSRLTYCREGVFRYDAGGCDVNGDPVVYYYDVSGNTLCRIEREGVDAGRFCGGVAFAAGMDGDQRVMYAVSPDGAAVSTGLMLVYSYEPETGYAVGLAYAPGETCAYVMDSDGNRIKRLEGCINAVSCDLRTETLRILFERDDGRCFYTALDKRGECRFAPVELCVPADAWGLRPCWVLDMQDGAVRLNGAHRESVWYGGCIFVVDDDGMVLLRNEMDLRCAVRNGVVYCDGVFLTSDALR